MNYYSNPNPRSLEVRPGFRVLGAMLALFVSYIEVDSSIPLFVAEHVPATDCSRQRRRLLCELGNWVWVRIPDHMQGPLDAIGHLLFALALVYIAWRLLKPLFTKLSRP